MPLAGTYVTQPAANISATVAGNMTQRIVADRQRMVWRFCIVVMAYLSVRVL